MKGFIYFLFLVVGSLLTSCFKSPNVDQTTPQLTKDTIAITSYLAKNNIWATQFPTGVWFIIDSATTGIRPTFQDSIKLKYVTKLLADSSVLDQSTSPKHFRLDSLLPAIQMVLGEFQVGSKGRIFLPSVYTGKDNWIFQFQLADVQDHQLKIDEAVIDQYLSAHSITAVADASGLRYTIDTLKSGPRAFLTDEVQMDYTVKNLSDGSVVEQKNAASFPVGNLILGLRIGIQKMREGSTFTFYLPSRLAYGPNGNGVQIEPNANLIFNCKLLKVTHH